ncbi:MAG: protein translocase subunit SecD [Planctomycetota bacterium]
MYKRTAWGMAGLVLLVALSIWTLGTVPIQLGIDLRGGTELIYELDLSRIEYDRGGVAETVKDTIAKRLDAYGLKEISVAVQGQDRLVIQLPGTDERTVRDLKRQIETAGTLTFRLVAPQSEQQPERLDELEREERDYVARDQEWVRRKLEDPNYAEPRPRPPDYIVRSEVERVQVGDQFEYRPKKGSRRALYNTHVYDERTGRWEPEGIVGGEHLSSVGQTLGDNYKPAVSFGFDPEGARLFGRLTGAHVGELLAIVLDEDIMEVATIKSRIEDRGQLTGDFTSEDVRAIVTILRGGSLPTKPKLISESTVGSLLGQDAIAGGIRAMIVAAAAVMVFMIAYYSWGGVVADIALALNLLLIFSFVALFRQTLTLPGLAGVILTLGMAVDANILIFERYREERRRGKPIAASLSAAYSRALSVIFDSNLTTILTGYVLFYMGTPEIKGFAVTLISGIFASFFTAVFVTRLVLSFFVNVGILREYRLRDVFAVPRVPFTRYRYRFALGSLLVIAATWTIVFSRGRENYGIDFTGGARVTVTLTKAIPLEDMRRKVADLAKRHPELFSDYSIQLLQPEGPRLSRMYTILTRAGASGGLLKKASAEEAPAPEKAETPAPGEPAPAPSPEPAPAPSPAGSSEGTAGAEKEPAQLVRDVLEKLLRSEGLLPPDPFPLQRWVIDTGATALAGSVYLELEVNLFQVSPEATTESIRQDLNRHLEGDPLLASQNRDPGAAYKGIQVASVQLVEQPTADNPVTRYSLRTTSYVPPPPAGLRAERQVPTQGQVEAAVRGYFRSSANQAKFRLLDPFPEVVTVGPRVASTLQADAIVALFISILGIVFYLSLRFEFSYGLGAIVALIHDALVVIGFMVVADAYVPDFTVKFNLTELAAVLSIIGYSVNDTIVVFDRIRENAVLLAKRKYSPEELADLSINQTLLRTIWTSLTTLIVVIFLLAFGGESVRGFSYLFAVGLISGTYSSVFIATPVALYLQRRAAARRKMAAAA